MSSSCPGHQASHMVSPQFQQFRLHGAEMPYLHGLLLMPSWIRSTLCGPNSEQGRLARTGSLGGSLH